MYTLYPQADSRLAIARFNLQTLAWESDLMTGGPGVFGTPLTGFIGRSQEAGYRLIRNSATGEFFACYRAANTDHETHSVSISSGGVVGTPVVLPLPTYSYGGYFLGWHPLGGWVDDTGNPHWLACWGGQANHVAVIGGAAGSVTDLKAQLPTLGPNTDTPWSVVKIPGTSNVGFFCGDFSGPEMNGESLGMFTTGIDDGTTWTSTIDVPENDIDWTTYTSPISAVVSPTDVWLAWAYDTEAVAGLVILLNKFHGAAFVDGPLVNLWGRPDYLAYYGLTSWPVYPQQVLYNNADNQLGAPDYSGTNGTYDLVSGYLGNGAVGTIFSDEWQYSFAESGEMVLYFYYVESQPVGPPSGDGDGDGDGDAGPTPPLVRPPGRQPWPRPEAPHCLLNSASGIVPDFTVVRQPLEP
jgi:hypothetical protein